MADPLDELEEDEEEEEMRPVSLTLEDLVKSPPCLLDLTWRNDADAAHELSVAGAKRERDEPKKEEEEEEKCSSFSDPLDREGVTRSEFMLNDNHDDNDDEKCDSEQQVHDSSEVVVENSVSVEQSQHPMGVRNDGALRFNCAICNDGNNLVDANSGEIWSTPLVAHNLVIDNAPATRKTIRIRLTTKRIRRDAHCVINGVFYNVGVCAPGKKESAYLEGKRQSDGTYLLSIRYRCKQRGSACVLVDDEHPTNNVRARKKAKVKLFGRCLQSGSSTHIFRTRWMRKRQNDKTKKNFALHDKSVGTLSNALVM